MKSLSETHPDLSDEWLHFIDDDLTKTEEERLSPIDENSRSLRLVVWHCGHGHYIVDAINKRCIWGCPICDFDECNHEEKLEMIQQFSNGGGVYPIIFPIYLTARERIKETHKDVYDFLKASDYDVINRKNNKNEPYYYKEYSILFDFFKFLPIIFANPSKLNGESLFQAIKNSVKKGSSFFNSAKNSTHYLIKKKSSIAGSLSLMYHMLDIIGISHENTSAYIFVKIKKLDSSEKKEKLEIKESDPKTTAKPRRFIWNETESELKRIFLSLTKEKDKRLNYIDETSWETFRDVFIESKEEKKKYKRITWTREAQLLSYLIHSFIQMDLIKKCSHNKIIEDRFKILECDNPEKFKSKDHLDWKKKLQTPNDAIDLMHLLKVSEYDFEKS